MNNNSYNKNNNNNNNNNYNIIEKFCYYNNYKFMCIYRSRIQFPISPYC